LSKIKDEFFYESCHQFYEFPWCITSLNLGRDPNFVGKPSKIKSCIVNHYLNYYKRTEEAREVAYPQGITSTTRLQPNGQLDIQSPTSASFSDLRGRVFAWGDISFLSKNIPPR
jgi:hypothetical protein